MEGTVIEYHPHIPAPPIPGEEPIEAYAVVKFDNGASSAIDSKEEGAVLPGCLAGETLLPKMSRVG